MRERILASLFDPDNNENPVFIFKDQYLTYGKLKSNVSKLIPLVRSELEEGCESPVLIYGSKSIEMISSLVAVIALGKPFIVVDPTNVSSGYFEEVLRQSQPQCLILLESIEVRDDSLRVFDLNQVKFALKRGEGSLVDGLRDLSTDCAYHVYTSGTSGSPKGIAISWKNVDSFVKRAGSQFGFSAGESLGFYNPASFNSDFIIGDLFLTLAYAGCLVSTDADQFKQPRQLFLFLKKFSSYINVISGTPTFLQLLVLNDDFKEKEFPKLAYFLIGGESYRDILVRQTLDKFPSANFFNVYGQTETTVYFLSCHLTGDLLDELSGVPFHRRRHGDEKIFNIEDQELVAVGDNVGMGYLDQGGGSAFVYPDPVSNAGFLFRTGDLVDVRDGYLFFKGRTDLQLKYKGFRVEPEGMEALAEQIEGVERCCVLPRYNNGTVDALVAFVQGDPAVQNRIETIWELNLRSSILPRKIIFSDVPLGEMLKKDRKSLREYHIGVVGEKNEY